MGRLKTTKACRIEGCDTKYYATLLCKNHYYELRMTPERRSWKSMKSRCTNENFVRYSEWGGRGIGICERWLNSFPDFLEDMGKRPSLDYTLDRIDNSKDYSPDNCIWATKQRQVINRDMPKNNTSGVRGVYWDSTNKKWHAQIKVMDKNIGLGRFTNIEDARIARERAESKYYLPVLMKDMK